LSQALGVKTVSGFVEQHVVEIGRKHLKFAPRARSILCRLHQRHRNGIRLLAGGTAQYPDADRLVTALLEDLGKDLALESVESVRGAEKTRNADENVGIECVEFLGVAAKESCITLQSVLFVQHHAPGDAPLDGVGFVEGEVHAGMIAKEQENVFETVLFRFDVPPISF